MIQLSHLSIATGKIISSVQLCPTLWESMDGSTPGIKKQRHHFADKGPYNQSYGFSSGHVWIWELDCEESWVPKIGIDSDAGRDWGQEEKGTTEDEMAGWHHQLNGCEFEWTRGVGDGQGGLACCDSWGRKELDTTERLNWTERGMGKYTQKGASV